jgi:hypothetical protein
MTIDEEERGVRQKKMEEDPEQMNGFICFPDFRSTYCLYRLSGSEFNVPG